MEVVIVVVVVVVVVMVMVVMVMVVMVMVTSRLTVRGPSLFCMLPLGWGPLPPPLGSG